MFHQGLFPTKKTNDFVLGFWKGGTKHIQKHFGKGSFYVLKVNELWAFLGGSPLPNHLG